MRKRSIMSVLLVAICVLCLMPGTIYAFDGPANGTEGDEVYDVTFYAHVDPNIESFTNYVYVEIQNMNNHSLCYEYMLLQANGYLLRVQLPPGEYAIVGGGIRNDWKGLYPVEYVEFTVGEVLNTFVEFSIGNPNAETVLTQAPLFDSNTPAPNAFPTSPATEPSALPEKTPEPTVTLSAEETDAPATASSSISNTLENNDSPAALIVLIATVAGIACIVAVVVIWAHKKSQENLE